MKKYILLISVLLYASVLFAITPRRVLPALNTALFRHSIPRELLRQNFNQLLVSQQLEAFTQAERTLLLTHQFIAENNRWPRTVIAKDGHLIPPEQYSPSEQQEVSLGSALRFTLEKSSKTDPLIREELENLKNRFSTHRLHQFMLDQLNDWLTAHNTWPRAEINSVVPLTRTEQAEIELAQYANKLTDEGFQVLPKELVEQIQFIRAMYDPSFHLFGETEPLQTPVRTNDNLPDKPLHWQRPPDPLATISPVPRASTSTVNIPGLNASYFSNLSGRTIQEEQFAVSESYAMNVRQELITWLKTYHNWPYLITDKSITQYTLLEMKGELLAKAISRLRKAHFDVDDIYSAWISGRLESDSDLAIILGREAPQQSQIGFFVGTPPELDPLTKPDLTTYAVDPEALLETLQTWLETYHAWPDATQMSSFYNDPQSIQATHLTWQIEAFVMNATPEYVKKRFNSSATWQDILASNVHLKNEFLAQLRLLYQQWH